MTVPADSYPDDFKSLYKNILKQPEYTPECSRHVITSWSKTKRQVKFINSSQYSSFPSSL